MNDLRTRTIEVRSPAGDDRSVNVICSSTALDGHGEVLEQDWDLKRYLRNPVVIFNHGMGGLFAGPEASLPIGHAKNVGVRNGRLEATLVFVDEKANPLAERVLEGFRQKSLHSVSVGFRPGKVRTEMRGGRETVILSQNELFEISVCPVGSNPDAVAKSLYSGHAVQARPAPVLDGSRALADLVERSYRQQAEAPRTRVSEFGSDLASMIACSYERGIDITPTEAEEIEFIAANARKMEGDMYTRQHPHRDTGSDALAALIERSMANE